MDKIIIFGSCYGTTKRYAVELSAKTGIPAKSYEDVNEIDGYNTIIYMGGLYAGGVQGMKKTLKRLRYIQDKEIFIITVGLADPEDKENTENIRNVMKTQLSKEIFEKAHIYHIRGGIDYSRLSFVHKTMMGMVYKKAVNLREDEKNAETRAMIETYNKQVDFVDFKSLEPIIQDLSSHDQMK